MPKTIEGTAREIILKVRRACEAEREHKGPLVPFSKAIARAAFLTGVSERTVYQISKEGKEAEASCTKIVTPGKNRVRKNSVAKIDDFDKCAIRQIIQSYYIVKKEIPTIHKLWMQLRTDTNINFKYCKTTLRGMLKQMGYCYKRYTPKVQILVEKPDISAWRARYLWRLRKNRADKRPVIYLDETNIHVTYQQQKQGKLNDETGILASDSAGARWIIAHAGGRDGFVKNGLLLFKSKSKSTHCHDEINSENFKKWIVEKIIPNLPPYSLIVMDNAPYHCTQLNKMPTVLNTKAYLQKWLTENNMPFEESWTKAQLYEIVKRCIVEPEYEIDNIFKEHRHEVIRLPPYHCDLNAIEMIWTLVKKRVAEKSANKTPDEIESNIETAISMVTVEDWNNVCDQIEKLEDTYYTNDRLLDIELDKL